MTSWIDMILWIDNKLVAIENYISGIKRTIENELYYQYDSLYYAPCELCNIMLDKIAWDF